MGPHDASPAGRRALVVAIDGPGGSGKSSVGSRVAKRLGYRFADTGVLYRGLTWLALGRGVDPDDAERLSALVDEIELGADADDRYVRLLAAGRDVTTLLHTEAVDRSVSRVSRHPEVRAALMPVQRRLAGGGGIIMAGRDIGSVILPDADLKIFLDVSVEERARRRAEERGVKSDSDAVRTTEAELRRRDGIDSTRAVAPLRVPDGATVVNTEGNTLEQTVSLVTDIVRRRQAEIAASLPGKGTPLLMRVAAALARGVLSLAARVRVEGLDNLPRSGPLIVVANHQSNADPPLVVGWLTPALGRPMRILAKEALFVGPLGALLRSQGITPVRSGGSDMEAFRAARAVLDRGEVLCIFPEGTRSRDGTLQSPKPGVAMLATRTGVPILPVGISGADRFLGRGQRVPRLRAPIDLRVGRPFTLAPDPALPRRAALEAASTEIMRRLAALVDPQHRGEYEPLVEIEPQPD